MLPLSRARGYDLGVAKPTLTFVPRRKATPEEAVHARLGAIPRPIGMLQCPACSGRAVITVRAGVIVREGKPRDRGTLILADHCAQCFGKGLKIRMVPGGQGPKPVK